MSIQHLHSLDILYRSIYPEVLLLTSDGYVQLMDMSNAVKFQDGAKPRDYCGAAHYLSPEQVSGQGHDKAVDYWATGILLYEMVVSDENKNPWLTGENDSEVNIYTRISMHKSGALTIPPKSDDKTTDEVNCERFLNGLLEPVPDNRLGVRGVGPEELRAASWMTDMDWYGLSNKTIAPPHASFCVAVEGPPATLSDKYTGDNAWCATYASFSGRP